MNIFIGTYDGNLVQLRYHHDQGLTLTRTFNPEVGSVRACAIIDPYLYVTGYQGNLRVFNHLNGLDMGSIFEGKECMSCLESYGRKLISAGQDGMIRVFEQLQLKKTIPSHNKRINCLAATENLLVSAAQDLKVKFWQLKSMTHIKTIKLFHQALFVRLSSDLEKLYIVEKEALNCLNTQTNEMQTIKGGCFQTISAEGLFYSDIKGNILNKEGKIVDSLGNRVKVLMSKGEYLLAGSVSGQMRIYVGGQEKGRINLKQLIISGALIQTANKGARVSKIKKS